MKRFGEFLMRNVLAGVLILAPVYLAGLLLFKAMVSLAKLMEPIAKLVPDWLPAENAIALLLIITICFVVGLSIRTRVGQKTWTGLEQSLFGKIPGYTLVRSLTQRIAGDTEGETWKPALAEIENALVPAFIIEELDDGRFTVFVPSVPTPFVGAVYVLARDRVHHVNVSFAHAVKAISRWGSGSQELVAAMADEKAH